MASKIQLPQSFKRFEQKDKENTRPAGSVLGKNNSSTVPEKAPETPSKTPSEPKTGTAKKLKVSDSCVKVKKSLVKEKQAEIYPSTFETNVSTVLATKITADKFNAVQKSKEQAALIISLTTLINQLMAKKSTFVTECVGIEESNDAEIEAIRKSAATALNGKEALVSKLQEATDEVETLKKEVDAARSSNTSLEEQVVTLTGKNSQLSCAARGTEQELELLRKEVEELQHTNEFKSEELKKLQEQLETVKRNLAEAQVNARAELAQVERSLVEQLEAHKLKAFEATRNLEILTKDKATADEQIAKFEVIMVTANADTLRARELAAHNEKACESYRNQIESLQSELSNRSAEVRAALAGFAKTQAFNEGRHEELVADLKTQREKVEQLQEQKAKLEEEVRGLTASSQELSRQLLDTTTKADAFAQEVSVERQSWEEAKTSWKEREDLLTSQFSTAQATWTGLQNELTEANRQLTIERNEAREKADHAQRELLTYQANAGASNSEQLQTLCKAQMENQFLKQQLEGKASLALDLAQRDTDIADLKDKLFFGERTRRELHNKIQELRGNIRVIVRVRPFLKHDAEQGPCTVEFHPNGQALTIANQDTTHNFNFDQVFSTTSTQEDIFNEVSNLVQSALDGYNVCLFSYGQTGSGKTHTMQGALSGPDRGIIPRAIAKVMEEAERLSHLGWSYKFEASYLEIYNEHLRDLLSEKGSSNLDIKMDPNKLDSVYVPGLTRMPIKDVSLIESVMTLAAKHRAVAGTDMNEYSSRSHAVFTLHIVGTNKEKDVVLEGSLNLCDLAGSERLAKSGAVGDRLKETQAINKSLSSLGDVFQALQSHNSHIPFRNSKLTYLLSPCLSGQGKTLMFVNLSPLPSSCDESLCSLRFASKVTACELGSKQVKNVKKIAAVPAASGSSIPPSSTIKKRPLAETSRLTGTKSSRIGF